MKITIYFAGGINTGSFSADIYLNGELAGWADWYGGKLKLKNIPEGENTIEIDGMVRRRVRFTASQNVKIWARECGSIDLFVKGEDIKILENVIIKKRRGEEERTEGPPLDGKPREEEKKEPKESAWESFKNKYI